jgi:hypothetical protein
VTRQYTITPASPLTNLTCPSGGCSGSGACQNDCAAPFGFGWTDTGTGVVISASVQWAYQGMCSTAGTQHAVTLNGAVVGAAANTISGCSCGTQPVVFNPSMVDPIIAGGPNTLVISSSTCDAINNAAGTIATVNVTYASPPIPAGLVHCWPAEGNGNDIVGGDYGTVYPDVTYTPGRNGRAFTCSGVAGLGTNVSTGAKPNVSNVGPWTYDLWVRWISDPQLGGTIVDRVITGSGNPIVTFGVDPAGNATWGVRGDSGGVIWLPVGTVTSGQWVHTAITRGGGVVTAYINGAVAGSPISDVFGSLTPDPPHLCGNYNDSRYGLVGQVDTMRIWNRALSGAEIASVAAGDGSCSAH